MNTVKSANPSLFSASVTSSVHASVDKFCHFTALRIFERTFMNTEPLNDAEQFVFKLCHKTFLSLWCYNNPLVRPGKELCDVLVVCDPNVIIFSVKDIELKTGNQPDVEYLRWERKAVDASVKQLYGADRWLQTATHVIRADNTLGLELPTLEKRKVHRIAVACGGKGEVSVSSGDFDKGYVHVFTEHDFLKVLLELDTIEDLLQYLDAKEQFGSFSGSILTLGSEAGLLGFYLFNERTFPIGSDMMVVYEQIWTDYLERPEVKMKKKADVPSYVWDRLIERLADPLAKDIGEAPLTLNQFELALRAMARETRFARRMLGKALFEFLNPSNEQKLRSRILPSASGVIYVVVSFGSDENAQERKAELGARLFVARHLLGCGHTMIGIGLGEYVADVGSTSDLMYLHMPEWTEVDEAQAVDAKINLGFFANMITRRCQEDEYPTAAI